MLHPAVHSRQFVLGPRPVLARPEWLPVSLSGGLHLSHCPKLKVAAVTDKRNRGWYLLGVAVQVDPTQRSPIEELRDSSAEDVSTVYRSWAGRWLLVGNGTIHLDACGLLGCYHRLTGAAAGRQQLWVSSSLPLLTDLPDVEAPAGQQRRLLKGDGFSWDPPPGTAYRGVSKLLPTQVLEIASGEIRPRRMELGGGGLTYDHILDELASGLVTAIRNLPGRLYLALSAGYDSRLVLAAAKAAGVPFSTYTQLFPGMLAADRALPPVLAQLIGVEHRYIHPAREERALLEAFDAHCGGQCVDIDRTFFARQQWHWTEPGYSFVRGGCFEVGRCFYWRQLPARRPAIEDLLKAFGAEHCPQYVRKSLADCMDWFDKAPIEGMDWRDRFYLESRIGGWGSATSQALDIVDGIRFTPANAARITETLLIVPEEKRRASRHQIDLIERLAPELLTHPFNQPDGFVRRARLHVRKCGTLLQERGLATTFHQIKTAVRRRLKQRVARYGFGDRQH